jgi:phospho-N-acetylmuramoyl-pentapeptide-transferase
MRQVLLAATIALVFSLFGTPVAIRLLVKQGYGQLIRDDGPTSHHTKRGTPTMGGAIIILGTLLGYAAAHAVTLRPVTVSGLLVLFLMAGLGLVGFVDDYIKVAKQRSLGLRAWAKLVGQMVIAVTFAILAINFPDKAGYTPASTDVSFIRDTGLALGAVMFVVWAYVMIAGTSNGVNLADGLDGLATGTSVMVFASYVLIGIWQFGNNCQTDLVPQC